jgi:hypothetical protein
VAWDRLDIDQKRKWDRMDMGRHALAPHPNTRQPIDTARIEVPPNPPLPGGLDIDMESDLEQVASHQGVEMSGRRVHGNDGTRHYHIHLNNLGLQPHSSIVS